VPRMHTDYLGDPACPACRGDGWVGHPTVVGLFRCECLLRRLDADREAGTTQRTVDQLLLEEAVTIERLTEEARIDAIVKKRLAIERARAADADRRKQRRVDLGDDPPGRTTIDPPPEYL